MESRLRLGNQPRNCAQTIAALNVSWDESQQLRLPSGVTLNCLFSNNTAGQEIDRGGIDAPLHTRQRKFLFIL